MSKTRLISVITALTLACAPALAAQDAPTAEVALTMEDKLEGMRPALDSIARAMGVDGSTGYAPRDGQFFWTVMYLMGVNWGDTHPLYSQAELNGQTVTSLARAAVEEMATAAFFDYADLPELIDTPALAYDAGTGSYLFSPSDMGETYTKIESYYEQESGNVMLTLGFYAGDGARLGSFDFTLAPNPHVDGTPNTIYYYSVMSAMANAYEND